MSIDILDILTPLRPWSFESATPGCDYPAESDVRLGVTYDIYTGTLVLPDPADVRFGISYGAGGTEFTGTLHGDSNGTEPAGPHPPAYVVRQLLVDLGIASNIDGGVWPAFSPTEPDRPDNCITVRDTTGQNDGRVHTDGELMVHDGIQIRIRATDQFVGYAKAREISEAICRTVLDETVVIGDYEYCIHCINQVGTINFLDKDRPRSDLTLFTINGLISMRQLV